MGTIRIRLGWLTLFALAAQLTGAALAPAALCCEAMSGSGDPAMMECCKKGGVHICPITKKKAAAEQAARSGQDASTECVMTSCTEPSSGALAALFGPVGVLVAPQSSAAPESSRLALSIIHESATSEIALVDIPPPRV